MQRFERQADQLRELMITPNVNPYAEGSCLIQMGQTEVYITASVEDRVPPHVPEGEGWVTAEYSMLPRANRERNRRDVSKLKLAGRSAEIQRLIGRSLRAVVDMKKLGPRTITIDCDVLVADGGTRTASITGAFVALVMACDELRREGELDEMPVTNYLAAISAGIVDGEARVDLEYEEDSQAEVDLNCVMDDEGRLIEIQGTGEGRPFTVEEQQKLVELCAAGIERLIDFQREILWRMMA